MNRHLDTVASQISDPIKWRRLNGWLVLFWMAMVPLSIATGLVKVIVFLSIISLYANWATHLGVWAGARAEAKQVEIQDANSD